MARCRTGQQDVGGTQGHADQGCSVRDTSVLQFLHHVSRISIPSQGYSNTALRLLFMTYNGWVMLAVAVGAFIGYLAFGAGMSSTKSVACH